MSSSFGQHFEFMNYLQHLEAGPDRAEEIHFSIWIFQPRFYYAGIDSYAKEELNNKHEKYNLRSQSAPFFWAGPRWHFQSQCFVISHFWLGHTSTSLHVFRRPWCFLFSYNDYCHSYASFQSGFHLFVGSLILLVSQILLDRRSQERLAHPPAEMNRHLKHLKFRWTFELRSGMGSARL